MTLSRLRLALFIVLFAFAWDCDVVAGNLRVKFYGPPVCLRNATTDDWACSYRVLVFDAVSSQILYCSAELTVGPYGGAPQLVTWPNPTCSKMFQPFSSDGSYDFEYQGIARLQSPSISIGVPIPHSYINVYWVVGNQVNEISACVEVREGGVRILPSVCLGVR
jgi:hypothetical protein